MLGAIIGDIVGSRFEWRNSKSRTFEFFTDDCAVTDDSIMTLAIGRAILACDGEYAGLDDAAVAHMREVGGPYPDCGYGARFHQWMYSDDPKPYNSFGNGAAMRVSPCGFAARSLEEAKLMARKVTEVTHNHPEGLKGAEAVAVCVYLARMGKSISEIRTCVDAEYYPLNFTLDGIRDGYQFDETCQGSVPQAITAFLESTDFEDAIRNAVFLGGDSDTIAAIAGGIAEGYYGIPTPLRQQALAFLDNRLAGILVDFENKYPVPRLKLMAGEAGGEDMLFVRE